MREEMVIKDITVVGGGLSGVCAAIAAARLGQTVALIQNRPVLGGNSSSEVRVWVCGATAHGINRYARETGIMGELFVENQFQNPDGNPYLWDLIVLEAVRAEANIQLFLNTDVHEVEADGDESNRIIRSVTGWMMGSERRIRFVSEVYLDCTGDGLIGFLAGAKFRIGREAREEFQEEWAPEVADDITLGSTILFYTKEVGHPVKYHPPSFAKDITTTSIPIKRVIQSGDSGCHYWWIEWGGELDTVHENERIRDELWSVIYGIWDYIKNSGGFDSANMTLEWVGALPGKREYRRFIGDYILNQNDILAQTRFEDTVAFGGWSIDLHPPQGMYSTESGSKHLHADGIYHIPFRSLYSVNVSNMLMAGRNISASHVAFGTTRVMATCAVIGEAAGTGAALCVQKHVTPRELYRKHCKELQQVLLRQDAALIGIRNADELDLGRLAKLKASSTLTRLSVSHAVEPRRLIDDVAVLFPVEPRLNGFELLVDVSQATTIQVELWDTGRAENYVPKVMIMQTETTVQVGEQQWVHFPLSWQPDETQNAFVIIKANEHVVVFHSDQQHAGAIAFVRGTKPIVDPKLENHQPDQPVVQWSMKNGVDRKPICFRLTSETSAFSAAKVTNGFLRPYGAPNQWMSEPMKPANEEWLELCWDEAQNLKYLQVTFNDNVHEDLINLHAFRTSDEVRPELVKDYRLEAWVDEAWKVLQHVTNNRKRTRKLQLEAAIATNRLRLVVEATNGSPCAEVVEIRIYG
ncbi:pyridine nucleotide-disulfide oxidoreductase [Paenibacillus sp. Soil766]|uniref:FAD-dependent oxidoreductase n=1 Tax=Paenibacillus sp. Soil766 TaxID=1736404 RepID=UPI0007095368|nr:FAD-dependent oxidoreductase [Paenibacillus sp. Soil766]KRF03760.1 pyridine nucleotide-disulfide oxidoreductase [Paenibacillus sp. Soil766]